ncbi:MAG TPA: hypothetical protein VJ951_08455 [Bacteroidales bacterium]|nr:hypothetical protein [Bacteroidales bacterium]
MKLLQNKTNYCLLILILPFMLFSCQGESPDYETLFSGTVPAIDFQDEITQPFVVFLDISEGQFAYNESNTPFSITRSNDETTEFSTNLYLSDNILVKNITYSAAEEKLILKLDDQDRIVELEKYDDMLARKVNEFVNVKLTSDISHLSQNQKEMLSILFDVADIMDGLFWKEACPEKDQILAGMSDQNKIDFFNLNYGPWERLNNNLPFIPGIRNKPLGAGFYPADMTKAEFEAFEDPSKTSLYTLIQRNNDGNLMSVPYHKAFSEQVKMASDLLLEAAELAEDQGFKKYLKLRAKALLNDDYLASDMAWMDMKDNDIDFVVGPIENYEDQLYNYKAAHEAFILIKDKTWSEKLAYISSLLPELQKALPVSAEYKQEVPGSDSDLGAYDAVYYAGDCNASSKTIAINLPNDERVQLAKGSRKLQLKNSIKYKFEEILVPISNVLIAQDQREHIQFDAFFENTMFHEVAHGLGLNNTINGKGTVRKALKNQYSAIEEGKADILGLFLVTKLAEMGELQDTNVMDNYVTFMASIFRSVRFGASSSHGKANMIRFYYFQEKGAFSRDDATGTYRIDFEKMQQAMNSLGEMILMIQGNGDYETAKAIVEEKGFIRKGLQNDLNRLEELNIPVDIKFEQGPEVLGL